MTLKVKVKIRGNSDWEKEAEEVNTVFDVFLKLGLSSQEYVATINNNIIPIDYPLNGHPNLTLIRIVTGG